jgi:GntR family transcriptional regulator, transcriptional repressor for pyruvate dehydrogenase complex
MATDPDNTTASPLRAIATTRLVDDVVSQLRRFIIENGLTVGDRLPPERALADQLGTSRATVAQAVRILAVMGLVEIRHGSGVFVRQDPATLLGTTFDLMLEMEPASVGELADFRYWIEKSMLDGDTVPPVDTERLIADFETLASSGSRLETWIEADADFHVTLVAATRNRYLHSTYEMAHRKILSVSYADWINRGATPSWLRGEGWKSQLDLHERILDAAVAGDHERLVAALGDHQTLLVEHLARAVDLTP